MLPYFRGHPFYMTTPAACSPPHTFGTKPCSTFSTWPPLSHPITLCHNMQLCARSHVPNPYPRAALRARGLDEQRRPWKSTSPTPKHTVAWHPAPIPWSNGGRRQWPHVRPHQPGHPPGMGGRASALRSLRPRHEHRRPWGTVAATAAAAAATAATAASQSSGCPSGRGEVRAAREDRGRVGLESPGSGTVGCDVPEEPSSPVSEGERTGSPLAARASTRRWKPSRVWVLDAWGPGDHATPSPIGRSSLIKH